MQRDEANVLADFELIATREALADLAHDLLSEKVLAVDTEADSFYHYFDKTCLVQIATLRSAVPLVGRVTCTAVFQ
jgi:ribonuclease D